MSSALSCKFYAAKNREYLKCDAFFINNLLYRLKQCIYIVTFQETHKMSSVLGVVSMAMVT